MTCKCVLASSHKFLDLCRVTESAESFIVFLDFDSLFTKTPVEDEIQIVIDNVYDNNELAPPNIPPNLLRDILITCIKETPFVIPTGQLYVPKMLMPWDHAWGLP